MFIVKYYFFYSIIISRCYQNRFSLNKNEIEGGHNYTNINVNTPQMGKHRVPVESQM